MDFFWYVLTAVGDADFLGFGFDVYIQDTLW